MRGSSPLPLREDLSSLENHVRMGCLYKSSFKLNSAILSALNAGVDKGEKRGPFLVVSESG